MVLGEDNNILKYVVKVDEDGKMLRDIIYKKMNLSSRLLGKVKRNNGIFLNGINVPLSSRVKTGDEISIVMEKEKNQFEAVDIPIKVVYEDIDLLVIDKQPGVVVHPTRSHFNDTIANGIANYLIKTNQDFKIRFINRLDRDTSGLLMIAKNSYAQQALSKQMESNLVEKYYVAVVQGVVMADAGTINCPIGRTEDSSIIRRVMEDGDESITHYSVIKRLKSATVLRLKLETGRTHQIRVHMKHIGHPIIGDELYGYKDESLISRQALHAETLVFNLPRSGERIKLRAEIPEDMKKLIEKLEA